MSWQEVRGHDRQIDWFRRAVRRGRLASTFLFVGPSGIGKRTFALKLAQALLCERNPESDLEPCGACEACQQVAAGTHPDLEMVSRPEDKNFIPIESFIGDREHRMREGLCFRIGMKPSRGGRKVAIIDDADYLNVEGANCLLKTLEEPPPKSVIVLIGTSEQRQLPTIRSRSQVIRFNALEQDDVAALLRESGTVESDEEARRLAALGDGRLDVALRYRDEELAEFRGWLYERLGMRNADLVEMVGQVSSFVDKAGKDASPRRARIRQIAELSADFYRQLMRGLSGLDVSGDATLRAAIAATMSHWRGDTELASACLDRCLDTMLQVEANANQATLLECWFDDLWLLTHGMTPAAIGS